MDAVQKSLRDDILLDSLAAEPEPSFPLRSLMVPQLRRPAVELGQRLWCSVFIKETQAIARYLGPCVGGKEFSPSAEDPNKLLNNMRLGPGLM